MTCYENFEIKTLMLEKNNHKKVYSYILYNLYRVHLNMISFSFAQIE
jgi:hypothetical protein